MRRGHRRRPARHRLDDRHPEALEAGRIDGDGRAAVEPRELLVGDEAEPDDVRSPQLRLVTPAAAARDREQGVVAEQAMRGDERLQVLARLERRHGEHVRPAEVGTLPVRPEDLLHARICDLHPLRPDTEPLDDVASGVLGVDEDEIGRARRVRVLGPVHRGRLRRHPLGEAQRHEVVDGRGADAAGLRRVHPVGVVEDVEVAEDALERGAAEPAPGIAPALRERQRHEAELDVEPVERTRNRPAAGRARRRERDDLVRPGRRLDEPGERAADVVADAGQRMRERADVVDDPHGRL